MDIIQKARTRMVARMPFFGLLAVYLTPAEGNTDTAATDGEYLYYNPVWVEMTMQTEGIEAVMGVVAHEVMHCALQHLWRRGNRDRVLWNIACDYAVNGILHRAGVPLPGKALYDSAFEHMTAEEIYSRLEKEARLAAPQSWGSHDRWEKAGSDGRGNGKEESGNPDGNGAASGNDSKGSFGENATPSEGVQSVQEGGAPESRGEAWKGRLAEVYQRARTQGFAPGGLERIVDEALKPDIPWEAVLADFMQRISHEYNWLPPDRRLIWNDIYVPSLSDGETVPEGVVAIDSSGSISDKLLGKFLTNVKSAAEYIAKLHIVVCDAQVWLWKTVEMADGKPFPPIQIHGGGGTDFRPVFEEIKKRGIQPQFLVYLTDGYGTYPERAPDYPVLWLSTGQAPPWGQYVSIPED